MIGMIQSVLGPVDPTTVGPCLIHEHLVIDYGELVGSHKEVPDAGSALEDQTIAGVRTFARAGGSLLVDCTPLGYGRYPDLLATVSTVTKVHIVACTGGFTDQWAPLHPLVRALDTSALADLFTRELTEGMGGTRIRAGAIKVATGERRMSGGEAHVFRAAARAQRATGAPIITHTTNGLGPEQARFLVREGVDPSRIVIGHIGFGRDPRSDIRAIAETGANFALDRIGHQHFFPNRYWIDLVRFVLHQGYQNHLLLSHDAVTKLIGPAAIAGLTFSDYSYVLTTFLPELRDAGVDERVLAILIQDNPRRVLTWDKPVAAE